MYILIFGFVAILSGRNMNFRREKYRIRHVMRLFANKRDPNEAIAGVTKVCDKVCPLFL